MKPYTHPKSLARSEVFQLQINGQAIEVLHTGVADFAICALTPSDFPATVEVTPTHPATSATIHPASKKIDAKLDGGKVRFSLDRPEKISVVIPGLKAFYVYAQGPETNPPDPADPSVVTFPTCQISESPMLTLEEGQTLYIPGGAVFKGRVHVKGKSGIRICGHGIFDGSFFEQAVDGMIPLVLLERCPDVLVEDVTIIRPQGWTLVLGACAGATVRNVKQIGEVISSDGIDVLGSSNVLIEDCFLHNNDDCVVVKAFFLGSNNLAATSVDASENVENVLVRHCTFANWHCGHAMEIGHELSVEYVRNITFTDIDVLHVHGHGSVFSIHNYGRATVSNILFENIRIEHCYDKLIDFRIARSRYSKDVERGQVRGVTLRNIQWFRTPFNEGYTSSLIGGSDKAHVIEDVVIENFQINGKPVQNLDELDIFTRHCRNLQLK